MIERRTFIAMVAGGPLASPPPSEAQQAGKVYRISAFSATPAPSSRSVPREIWLDNGLKAHNYLLL
jgi:hypothetical protein